MEANQPVVVAARRTPVGTAGRSLARLDVTGLAAPVLAALVEDVTALGLRGPEGSVAVDDVVLGNCCGPGGDVARVAALAAGLGTGVPGVTVDRQCGSGLEAVRLGAQAVAAGEGTLVLAGGVESASTMPWRLARPAGPTQPPRAYTRAPFAPPGFADPEMGAAADALAAATGVDRPRQDAYAVRSHDRALAARARGVFDAETVPVGGVAADERPRRVDARVLARLRPAFTAGGTATAGNSCGINDGAAAVALVPEAARAAAGVPGLRVLAAAVVGVDPALPGIGPVPAVRAVLARAGRRLDEVAVLEVTEAFAGQVLACTDALGLDPFGADAERVCPDGGAIALGHPWGASGALLVVRLFARLVRDPAARAGDLGIATCAVGGGQGIAVLVERVG
ncbi:thiolase family protein [Kineosporia sp. R_H_3]|uniref:thiolase family protein n=1 Tax=Kineosporia sp. R_H_3 TaxID=1961848 RepID=UPI0018EA02EA|nr:thiolase family protein [Kineosporia sp. R_H_3]